MHSVSKKWYVVYTRPRWEKKVSDLLNRKKIENYCPLNKVQKQWSDRKKIIAQPLFSAYVFVHINITEQLDVRLTDGIINFVYWLGKPAVIRDEEIFAINQFLQDHKNVCLEKTPVNIHDTVRVIGGPMLMQKGQVVSIRNKTLKVILPSLGYMMYAELDASNVELITDENEAYPKKDNRLHAFK